MLGKTAVRAQLEKLRRLLDDEKHQAVGFTPDHGDIKRAFLRKQWGLVHMPHDVMTFLNFLDRFANRPHVSFCEIGVYSGLTANRIVEYLRKIGVGTIEYFGIDNVASSDATKPVLEFKEMSFHQGNANVLPTMKKEYDFIFIDACHCAECVFDDSIVASTFVKQDGYLLFHDTSLQAQYPWSRTARRHGNLQHYQERKGGSRPLGVVEGISMARSRWDAAWRLIVQDHDFLPWGGIRIYQKTQEKR